MPDDHIQALDFRLFENLHQGRELDLAANQQSTSEKCAVTAAGKNPIAIRLCGLWDFQKCSPGAG